MQGGHHRHDTAFLLVKPLLAVDSVDTQPLFDPLGIAAFDMARWDAKYLNPCQQALISGPRFHMHERRPASLSTASTMPDNTHYQARFAQCAVPGKIGLSAIVDRHI